MKIRPKLKLWFVDDNGEFVFGLGMMRLLAAIDRLGSINAASHELKMSYRYALKRITTAEDRLGRSLVERTRGGKGGGGAKLTPFGRAILIEYEELETSFERLIDRYINLSD